MANKKKRTVPKPPKLNLDKSVTDRREKEKKAAAKTKRAEADRKKKAKDAAREQGAREVKANKSLH